MSYFSLRNLTPGDMNRIANDNFSNYDDEFAGYDDDFSGYDDALEFGDDGIDSFLGEGAVNRQFQVLIDNNDTSNTLKLIVFAGAQTYKNKVINMPTLGAISSGVYPVTGTVPVNVLAPPAGLMLDGYFQDMAGISTSSANGLTASSLNNRTIYELMEYLRFNPTRLLKMKVTADNSNQIQVPFTIKKLNPFHLSAERLLYPANSQNQFVNQDKISVFDANIVLGSNDVMEYSIVPSCQATVTFFFGASKDHGKGLSRQGKRADFRRAITPGIRPTQVVPGLPGRK